MSSPENTNPPAPAQPPVVRSVGTVIPFSLNQFIYIRMTDAGRAWLRTEHAILNARTGKNLPFIMPHENAQGFSRWTMWEFANAFGAQLFQGNWLPVCSMDILLDFKAPS